MLFQETLYETCLHRFNFRRIVQVKRYPSRWVHSRLELILVYVTQLIQLGAN